MLLLLSIQNSNAIPNSRLPTTPNPSILPQPIHDDELRRPHDVEHPTYEHDHFQYVLTEEFTNEVLQPQPRAYKPLSLPLIPKDTRKSQEYTLYSGQSNQSITTHESECQRYSPKERQYRIT